MLSINSNRIFLIKTPNQIIQEQPEISEPIIKKEEPKVMKNISKKQKYFLPEFYL